jgi:hypothetical protein
MPNAAWKCQLHGRLKAPHPLKSAVPAFRSLPSSVPELPPLPPSALPSFPPPPILCHLKLASVKASFFSFDHAFNSDASSSVSPSPGRSGSGSPAGPDTLTLRALVSTKDAGVIIGKAGKNVADLRDQTGVKAGVSKVVPGVHERVLTISGSVDRVAKVGIHL